MKTKRIMGFFFALVMVMGCMSLHPIAGYANVNVNDGVKIDDNNNFPDETFRTYVKDFDTDGNGYLSQTELDKVTRINVHNSSPFTVHSLQGIEYFKNLKRLYCFNNDLTVLDVSHNTELTVLECYANKLNSLNLGNNTKLTRLNCANNPLTSLDVSKNTELTELICFKNQLSSLDVSHNTELLNLNCSFNKLMSLDVSHNTELGILWCGDNQLNSLDVSNNAKLKQLYCFDSNLTSLDVSKNTELTTLGCSKNELTSLDVSHNTELNTLYCDNQQYNITVAKGVRKFEYSKFPKGFDKGKVISSTGATFGDDALTVNSDTTSEVTYKYKVSDNDEMDVKLNVTFIEFNPTSMKVTTQPTKLKYTGGETLDLTGLVVTLEDGRGETKTVEPKDFDANRIKATPENGKKLELTDDGKPVTLKSGNLAAETKALKVKAKEYTVTFKDGDKTQTVKVENGKTIATESMPANPTKAGYTFKEWNTKKDGKGDKFTGTIVVNGDMTVHAIYTKDPVFASASADGEDLSEAEAACATVAMYRLYNKWTHEHLFTTDAVEKDNLVSLGWNFEGITGKVYMHGEKGGVYRLYNPNTGEHHYTTKEDELAKCVKAGWKNEGVKFFSVLDADKQTVGMVSMYNPYEKKFYHHYTSDADEIAKMVKDGWRKEEIKWYAAK